MSAAITLAVARRVLLQLRRDPRTIALLLVVPCLLMALLWWMYSGDEATFDALGPPLLAMFPFTVMFLVTSVTTLRERSSGTLERLLSMPMGKLDLLVGYALAFGLVALVQALLAVGLTVGLLGLNLAGPIWALGLVAVVDAVLGTVLGLFVSAFAETEFQAVQFMPALVLPQVLLCGLFVSRDSLPACAACRQQYPAAELRRRRDAAGAELGVPYVRLLGRPRGDRGICGGAAGTRCRDAAPAYGLT